MKMDIKLSASRGLCPADPQQGLPQQWLCPWTLLRAPTADSCHTLYLRARQGPPCGSSPTSVRLFLGLRLTRPEHFIPKVFYIFLDLNCNPAPDYDLHCYRNHHCHQNLIECSLSDTPSLKKFHQNLFIRF